MFSELDNPENISQLRSTLDKKRGLRAIYREVYDRYSNCLSRSTKDGLALELGSGGGFAKEVLPELVTSDVLPYSGVDTVVDATAMPYSANSLRMICMFNVLHHVRDAEAFFREALRCLKPGGRICITDQYPGLWSKLILKYAHYEHFDDQVNEWKFESSGPLSSANGALPWIIFFRDREKFESLFPELKIDRIELHTPLRYWLSGGLKKWSLLPEQTFSVASLLDEGLIKLSGNTASFFTLELVKNL